MLTLTSQSGIATCIIAPETGGRIESLQIHRVGDSATDDPEVLLTRENRRPGDDEVFFGGCFIMAPYCGRVRDGIFRFDGRVYELPKRRGPHAIHGTVTENHWVVLQHTESSAVLACELGKNWPFEGTIHHNITLDDDALFMTLTLNAHEAMPAQIGWHPWFRPPQDFTLPFDALMQRDDHGITTAKLTNFEGSRHGTFDDCFVGPHGPIVLSYPEFDLILNSDCSHWVVFDQRTDGVCFEPQSGPPNAINDCPQVLHADERLSHWFEVRWREHRRN